MIKKHIQSRKYGPSAGGAITKRGLFFSFQRSYLARKEMKSPRFALCATHYTILKKEISTKYTFCIFFAFFSFACGTHTHTDTQTHTQTHTLMQKIDPPLGPVDYHLLPILIYYNSYIFYTTHSSIYST